MDEGYWTSYLYLYGVGGVLFFSAIILGFKKKVITLSKKNDRQLLMGFLFAYFAYAGVHAFWNFQAIGAMK
jgi:hypothetical protein